MAIEEPSYQVIEREGGYELREYAPHLVAETLVAAGFEEAGDIAFGRLARYIGGANRSRRKIEMTAPVTQSRGEQIAMTAPVNQSADEGGFRIAFVVPSAYTLENVPEPTDPSVRIREVPPRLVASYRYSGRWTEALYREKEAELRALIEARGLRATADPILARYNAPFVPFFLRRNEVLIPVTRTSS